MRYRFPIVVAILFSFLLYVAAFAQTSASSEGTIPNSGNIYLPLISHAAPKDTKPPQLVSWSFDPTVDTVVSEPEIIFSARFTDDLSGVKKDTFAYAIFSSPSDRQETIVRFNSFENLVSGNIQDGTYSSEMALQRISEKGKWNLKELYIEDNAGNFVYLTKSDVTALGLPTSFTVTN